MKQIAKLLFLTVPGAVIIAALLISLAILTNAGLVRIKFKNPFSKTVVLGQKSLPSATTTPAKNLKGN